MMILYREDYLTRERDKILEMRKVQAKSWKRNTRILRKEVNICSLSERPELERRRNCTK